MHDMAYSLWLHAQHYHLCCSKKLFCLHLIIHQTHATCANNIRNGRLKPRLSCLQFSGARLDEENDTVFCLKGASEFISTTSVVHNLR